ncbi:MAG: hypothetical protein JXL97_16595 [Bacteroidales bacterium]|nr:hypothetical protein [Candidatus Woesearchaeota archaeon]MBN2893493.1 hypothetical protein [Bacteroidales bacterium]
MKTEEFETPKIEMEEQESQILKEPIEEEPQAEETTLEEPRITGQSEEYKTFAKTIHTIIFSVVKMQVEEDKRELLDESGARIMQKWDKWQFVEKYGAEATYLMLWGDILQVNFFSKKAQETSEEKEEKFIPIENDHTPQPKTENQPADFTQTLARL